METTDLSYLDEPEPIAPRNWKALAAALLILGSGALVAVQFANKRGTAPRKADDVIPVAIQPAPDQKPPVFPPPNLHEVIPVEQEHPEEHPEPPDTGSGLAPGGSAPSWGSASGQGAGRKKGSRAPSLVSTWTPYAKEAAARIAEAMRRHSTLKSASMAVVVRIWIDSAGRVSRALVQPTGDPQVDATLKQDVLEGMQLSGPPPAGMLMPVSLQLTARRPG